MIVLSCVCIHVEAAAYLSFNDDANRTLSRTHMYTHTHRDDTHTHMYIILCYKCTDGGLPLV